MHRSSQLKANVGLPARYRRFSYAASTALLVSVAATSAPAAARQSQDDGGAAGQGAGTGTGAEPTRPDEQPSQPPQVNETVLLARNTVRDLAADSYAGVFLDSADGYYQATITLVDPTEDDIRRVESLSNEFVTVVVKQVANTRGDLQGTLEHLTIMFSENKIAGSLAVDDQANVVEAAIWSGSTVSGELAETLSSLEASGLVRVVRYSEISPWSDRTAPPPTRITREESKSPARLARPASESATIMGISEPPLDTVRRIPA